MYDFIHPYIDLLARILLAIPFIHSAMAGFLDYNSFVDMMKAKSIPLIPVLLPIALAIKLIGSVFLVMGVLPNLAALVLALFTLLATFIFHSFWSIKDPKQRQAETYWFTTNLGLIGGLILYANM